MTQVAIKNIKINPQVRKVMDQNKLEEMADTIKEHGIIEPVVVRELRGKDGGYELIAGERRIKAAEIAGLSKIDVVIRNDAKAKTTITQLIENLQREDMNDMDLAEGFQKSMTDDGYSVEELCTKIGKTKGFVKQRLTLLKVHPEVQNALRRGEIEFSAARALSGLSKDEQPAALAEAINEENEARKARDEKKAKILELSGLTPPEEEKTEEEDGSGEERPETTEAKERKPRKSLKKPEPKAKTSTVKRVTRRRKREKAGKQQVTKGTEERLAEKSKEWVAGFIDEDTKGKGLEDSLSAMEARNLLKRYSKYLLDQRVLIVR